MDHASMGSLPSDSSTTSLHPRRSGPHPAPDPYHTSARALLLDNMAANLSTDRREPALHLSANMLNGSRCEIMHQTHRIGANTVAHLGQPPIHS